MKIEFSNSEKSLTAEKQFAPDGWARASLVFVGVLRTLIGAIAQNLHKLFFCLRYCHIFKKTQISCFYFFIRPLILEKIATDVSSLNIIRSNTPSKPKINAQSATGIPKDINLLCPAKAFRRYGRAK